MRKFSILFTLISCAAMAACAVFQPTAAWTPVASADVEVNVALGAVAYLKSFEAQVPGAQASIKAAGLAIAGAVVAQANGMVAGINPLVQSEQAAISAVTAVAPQLTALLTTKQTGSGSAVTVAVDLAAVLVDEINYVLPALAAANAGTVTITQLEADEAALTAAAAAL